VAIFGFVLVQHHQNVFQYGIDGQNQQVLPGLRSSSRGMTRSGNDHLHKDSLMSPFESMSAIGIQQQGYAWMQARKHATEDMFKLSMHLLGGEDSKPAPGVKQDSINPHQADQYDSSRSGYFNSFGGLPDWAGRGDHKLVVGSNNVESFGSEMMEDFRPHCTSFDHDVKRPTHGCDVNKDTMAVYCNFNQLRIDNSKINMDRGGEVLSTVMGREESLEFPKYERGAFAVSTKPDYQVPAPFRSKLHYLENVLNSIRYPTERNQGKIDLSCDETYPGITLFTTRYEYVNLYHTLTDWWSAYFVMPKDYAKQPHRVVFLDAHAQGGLDDVWRVLFGELHYIKHLPQGKGLCFEKAVFIPAGYKSALFPDYARNRCPNREMAAAFSDFVLKQYNLQSIQPIRGNIVIVDRQPYVSHPRSDMSNFQRKSNNFEKLKSALEKLDGVTVQLVRLETLSFGDQLKLIRQAHVLIGNHGAALSHLMFMDPTQSHVIEFTLDYNDFFEYLSDWRGINHEMIRVEYTWDIGAEQISTATNLVRGFMSLQTSMRNKSRLTT
jgi:Glycosyltransferase 61